MNHDLSSSWYQSLVDQYLSDLKTVVGNNSPNDTPGENHSKVFKPIIMMPSPKTIMKNGCDWQLSYATTQRNYLVITMTSMIWWHALLKPSSFQESLQFIPMISLTTVGSVYPKLYSNQQTRRATIDINRFILTSDSYIVDSRYPQTWKADHWTGNSHFIKSKAMSLYKHG